jgi:rhodanese-related sulfurtransferase
MKIHHAIFAFFFVTGCMFQQPDYLKVITATELHSILQQQNVFLLDVHIPEQRHIKGTDAFIPFHDIEKNRDKLPSEKKTAIYIYCEGGPMGNAAARSLHELGYDNLYNLDGGAHAWQQAGFDFE